MSRIKTAAMLFMNDIPLTGTALTNAAKYDRFWLKVQDAAAPPFDWAGVKADYVDVLRAANPDQKIGMFIGAGAAYARQWDPMYTAPDSQLLHKPNGDLLIETLNGVIYRWIDYERAGVRADHKALYRAFCETYDFDNIFWDAWDPSLLAGWVTLPDSVPGGFFGLPGGIREGRYDLASTWGPIIGAWTAELRDALAEDGREVWVNGIGDFAADAFMGTFHSNVLDYASGALDEGILTAYHDATTFARTISGMRLASAKGGETFYLAMPWLWLPESEGGAVGTVAQAFPIPDDTTFSRFFTAMVLIGGDANSHLGYMEYHQIVYFGYIGSDAHVYWNDDWNHDFGEPTGHAFDGGTTLPWWRQFTRGYAVVNPTASVQTFNRPGIYRIWHPTEGYHVTITPTTPFVLPPFTGWFLFENEAA